MPRARLARVFLLALAICLAAPGESRAAACTNVAGIGSDSGVGGTGYDDPDSGIGGTGHDDSDSGIGGTGHDDSDSGIGGTGVFGTITGFASVCINGLEIHYDPDVPVTANGDPASPGDLAVGRVVWIVAVERGEQLVATSIAMLSAVIGSLDEVDRERGLLSVNGEIVEVPPSALVLGELGGAIEPGVRVDVSGLRRPDGRVVASRIDVAGPGSRRSSMLRLGALLHDSPHLGRLSIEGFAAAHAGADRFDLDGVEVDARRVTPRNAVAGLRLTVDGPVREGVLRAERLTIERVAPERPERPQSAPKPQPAPERPQSLPEPQPAPERLPRERPTRVERRPEVPLRLERQERPRPIDRVLKP